MHTPQDKLSGKQRMCADFVCWVDYLPSWVYRLYVKVPGAYRLYKWAERNQH